MQTYGQYSPTPYDVTGLACHDRQTWFVAPVGRNRDSDHLYLSNWAAALALLGDESETVEVHRFGHWACGWFEIILVAPMSIAHVEALRIESALEEYPLLDEEDHSNREFEACCEAWEAMGVGWDRIDACKRAGVSIFAARRESPYDADPGNGAITDRLLGH